MWDLTDWLDEHTGDGFLWFLKRLSGNDTGITGGHQAGPYIPKHVLFGIFPDLHRADQVNPRVRFECSIDSHSSESLITAIWYNNKTRNETRLTGFGGATSALFDSEATGALTVFAFDVNVSPARCHVWICDEETEADLVEERVGQVDPGMGRTWPDLLASAYAPKSCWLDADKIPPEWLVSFPSGEEIIRKALELRPEHAVNVDTRLLRRRDCEYQLFQSVEEAIELPRATLGYTSMKEFLEHAQSVLQRRKARAGNSLQLHVRQVFLEESLREGHEFSYNPISEAGKRPDFLFPSADAYHNSAYPEQQLRMLAVKTTTRDRWRQILNEASRIGTKHLFTLQEGVSVNQFQEMLSANVQLVVPASLHQKYPASIRSSLQTLESFMGDIRLLNP